jgi:transcriptional regulator with XRE-family HTH domain
VLVNRNRIGNTRPLMLHSAQIRAARALLNWRQDDLAKAAKIGLATIQRMEQREGPVMGNISTLMRIQEALETAGVCFLSPDGGGGPGVRMSLRRRA